MKSFITILIILAIAIRPVLPLVNYVINYDYIVQNLCENRSKPESTCHGKCYLAKELSKTEKQNQQSTIKINSLDVFLPKEVISFNHTNINSDIQNSNYSEYQNHYHSHYFSDIFHPPLI
ncbi:MAG: hypothetical protein DI529_08760 [Chryseobacterium sp.]|nr:MAG: hypothetical protein DI529_08760 [Chryseobacterium sp.]